MTDIRAQIAEAEDLARKLAAAIFARAERPCAGAAERHAAQIARATLAAAEAVARGEAIPEAERERHRALIGGALDRLQLAQRARATGEITAGAFEEAIDSEEVARVYRRGEFEQQVRRDALIGWKSACERIAALKGS